jgi:glycerophosphoryl diester phosphodiesterase
MALPSQASTLMSLTSWTGRFPVVVIAHRGFSGAAPENTLAAFSKAVETGCDMIEIDVQLSRDGEVVVIHDDTLDRTTNGKGKVSQHTLQDLKTFDAGLWFSPQFTGERIPALKEALALTCGKIPLTIELKKGDLGQYTLFDLADRALAEVEKAGCLGQVVFSSFDRTAIERILKRNSRIPVAYIYNKPWNSPLELRGEYSIPILNCRQTILTKDNLMKAHQAGLKVNVWTVDTEPEMELFLDLGVDGIISNHPDRAIQVLKKRQTSK